MLNLVFIVLLLLKFWRLAESAYHNVKESPIIPSGNRVNIAVLLLRSENAHSKQLFAGHLYDACVKKLNIALIKIITSASCVEIRIAFLICYLQSWHEIELVHYFCPEFVGHVTNQKILVDAGKLM